MKILYWIDRPYGASYAVVENDSNTLPCIEMSTYKTLAYIKMRDTILYKREFHGLDQYNCAKQWIENLISTRHTFTY